MSDDIVTRLRDLAMKEESPWANIYDHVMREAADEIERLRTLGDALANTGGQHGFDEALDNWKEMRGD